MYATPPIYIEDLRIRLMAEVKILKKNLDLMKTVMRRTLKTVVFYKG